MGRMFSCQLRKHHFCVRGLFAEPCKPGRQITIRQYEIAKQARIANEFFPEPFDKPFQAAVMGQLIDWDYSGFDGSFGVCFVVHTCEPHRIVQASKDVAWMLHVWENHSQVYGSEDPWIVGTIRFPKNRTGRYEHPLARMGHNIIQDVIHHMVRFL